MTGSGNNTDQMAPDSAAGASDAARNRFEQAALWREAAGGSQAAVVEILARHGRYLNAVARSLAPGNAADAEDLVQETFVAALSSTYRAEASLRTWLVSIMIRRAAMLRRSRSGVRAARPLETTDSGLSASADRPGPAAIARLDLVTVLRSLSEEHRQVIILREFEGRSYDEMAVLLNVPRGTIESRLHRARQQLRERFPEYLR